MSGSYLLDTSIIIDLFAKDETIKARLEKAENTFIPSIAVGELYYGARKSARVEKNIQQIEQLVIASMVLSCMGKPGIGMALSKISFEKSANLFQKMTFGFQP